MRSCSTVIWSSVTSLSSRFMFCRFFGTKIVQRSAHFIPVRSMSSTSKETFTDELVRQRLLPHLDTPPGYVDELAQSRPRLKRSRRASVLVPLYCNQVTNRIEVLLIKRSEKMRSHTGMVGECRATTTTTSTFALSFSFSRRHVRSH